MKSRFAHLVDTDCSVDHVKTMVLHPFCDVLACHPASALPDTLVRQGLRSEENEPWLPPFFQEEICIVFEMLAGLLTGSFSLTVLHKASGCYQPHIGVTGLRALWQTLFVVPDCDIFHKE